MKNSPGDGAKGNGFMERRNMCVHATDCNPVGQSADAALIFRRQLDLNCKRDKCIVIQWKLCIASCECLKSEDRHCLLKYFPFCTL